jgi:hypothetical protein
MMDWLLLSVLAVSITCGGTALLFYVILLRSSWALR